MKILSLNQFFEKLKISPIDLSKLDKVNGLTYVCHPKTKEELQKIIEERIKKEGTNCDLNDIDVSEINDMSKLFQNSKFNGDISKWDVSNVTNMHHMFLNSLFNNDISEWDVSNVKDMHGMFFYSDFNHDISKWDVSNVVDMSDMFSCSVFDNDISNWKVSDKANLKNMFFDSPLENNHNLPKWYKQEPPIWHSTWHKNIPVKAT